MYLTYYSKDKIHKQWKINPNLFSLPWLPGSPPLSQYFYQFLVYLSREIVNLYKWYIHTLLFDKNSILCTLLHQFNSLNIITMLWYLWYFHISPYKSEYSIMHLISSLLGICSPNLTSINNALHKGMCILNFDRYSQFPFSNKFL